MTCLKTPKWQTTPNGEKKCVTMTAYDNQKNRSKELTTRSTVLMRVGKRSCGDSVIGGVTLLSVTLMAIFN